MIDILYTILIFSGLMVLFKLFDRLKVDNLQAIAVNYFVAGICGIVAMDGKIQVTGGLGFDNPNPQYFIPTAIIIGFLFGVVFNLIAYGTQKIGISITSVANHADPFFCNSDHGVPRAGRKVTRCGCLHGTLP